MNIKQPDFVEKTIKAWIGERPVPADVLEREELLLGIQREIDGLGTGNGCHRHILQDVISARAIIAEEVEAAEEDLTSKNLMGRRTPEEREIAEAGQDAGC